MTKKNCVHCGHEQGVRDRTGADWACSKCHKRQNAPVTTKAEPADASSMDSATPA